MCMFVLQMRALRFTFSCEEIVQSKQICHYLLSRMSFQKHFRCLSNPTNSEFKPYVIITVLVAVKLQTEPNKKAYNLTIRLFVNLFFFSLYEIFHFWCTVSLTIWWLIESMRVILVLPHSLHTSCCPLQGPNQVGEAGAICVTAGVLKLIAPL